MAVRHVELTVLDPRDGWLNAPVHVHELHGRPTLLHFWSLHQEGSREQLVRVLTWLDAYGPRGLNVIGVHEMLPGESPQVALDTNVLESQVVRGLGIHHPVAVDDGTIAQAYGVGQVPAYLVFDARGVLRHRAQGPRASRHMERVLELLTRPVAEAPAAP